MSILTRAMAAASIAALLAAAPAGGALGEPRVGAHAYHGHGHRFHGGPHVPWHGGGATRIGPVGGVTAGVAPAPMLPPYVPPPPTPNRCLPTAPTYDSYGAYVANPC